MTTDIGTLTAAARKAQAALGAAQAEQAAVAATRAAERREREIAWAFATIVDYPGKAAAASADVAAALAAFAACVVDDYGQAPARYLALVRAQAVANAAAEELTRARNVLRAAAVIPSVRPNRSDPVGVEAPYPSHGLGALPGFSELVESTIAAARSAASRSPAMTVDPGSFTGTVTDGMRRAALAADFRPVEELESRLGLREQHPDRFARNVSDAQKAEVAAYAACREAAGYGAPLPKVAVDRLRETLPPLHAPDDRETFTLYGPDHRPAQR